MEEIIRKFNIYSSEWDIVSLTRLQRELQHIISKPSNNNEEVKQLEYEVSDMINFIINN